MRNTPKFIGINLKNLDYQNSRATHLSNSIGCKLAPGNCSGLRTEIDQRQTNRGLILPTFRRDEILDIVLGD